MQCDRRYPPAGAGVARAEAELRDWLYGQRHTFKPDQVDELIEKAPALFDLLKRIVQGGPYSPFGLTRLTFGLTGREAITIELPLETASELLANGILRLALEERAALSAIIKHERKEVERLERERTAEALERRLP